MERKINRIKTMLVDKGKTNKWLATQLEKTQQQSANGVRMRLSQPSKQ